MGILLFTELTRRRLPEGHFVYGSFLVGYPHVKYRLIPKRKSVDVTWR
jgi:hypothetical protein